MPRIVRILLLVVLFTLALSLPGLALTEIPKVVKPVTEFEVAPIIGGYFFASGQALDPTPLYGVRAGYHIVGANVADSIGVEANVNYFSTSTSSGSKATGYLFGADAVYSLTPRKVTVPFFSVGIGGMSVDKGPRTTGNFIFNWGLGVKHFLTNHLALRFDAHQLFVYDNVSTRTNYEILAGVSYSFTDLMRIIPPAPPKPKKALPALAVPELKDDGKSEEQEPSGYVPEPEPAAGAPGQATPPAAAPAAPGTPATGAPAPGAPEATPGTAPTPAPAIKGAPAGREVGPATEQGSAPEIVLGPVVLSEVPPLEPAVLAPRAQAKSAAPPAGQPTQTASAPAAGIPAAAAPARPAAPAQAVRRPAQAPQEELVLEPVEPEQAAVPERDETGVVRRTLGYLTVEFDFNKTVVRAEYAAKIDALAAMLKKSPDVSVRIEGHTDSVGRNEPNLRLSEARAQVVARELVARGVNTDRISTKGFGFGKPKASNRSAKGRQVNRRAEILTLVVQRKDATQPSH
nr:OmpA family protein [Geomonas sp. Red32]